MVIADGGFKYLPSKTKPPIYEEVPTDESDGKAGSGIRKLAARIHQPTELKALCLHRFNGLEQYTYDSLMKLH